MTCFTQFSHFFIYSYAMNPQGAVTHCRAARLSLLLADFQQQQSLSVCLEDEAISLLRMLTEKILNSLQFSLPNGEINVP